VLRDVRQIRGRYAADLFWAQPAELARALAPATGGRMHRAWAFVSNTAYRASRNRLLALRAAPAPSATLRQEALEAEDVLCRWHTLGAASAAPMEAPSEKELAALSEELAAATGSLGAVTEGGPLTSMPLAALASRLRALAADQRTPYLLPAAYGT